MSLTSEVDGHNLVEFSVYNSGYPSFVDGPSCTLAWSLTGTQVGPESDFPLNSAVSYHQVADPANYFTSTVEITNLDGVVGQSGSPMFWCRGDDCADDAKAEELTAIVSMFFNGVPKGTAGPAVFNHTAFITSNL
jgi:hypothetical protein